jgi:acetyltransferase
MSIRNLDYLFDPTSVAVFGASQRPDSVGGTVWSNLIGGTFKGEIYAVNPRHSEFDGRPVYANASGLPTVPDMAVICTPPATVVGLIQDLSQRGTHAAVVLTAGLSLEQKNQMLAVARPSLLRILGPNCIGLLSPHIGLNASFAPINALPGELAFISQSGALVTAMLDWAEAKEIGFSHFISLGEHTDVDFGYILDYLASDAKTKAILLYMESIESPRKFMSAARAAARNKPVIVVKAGRSQQGQRAAASHSGALSGSDLVYDAAISRAGMLRVDTLQQLFLAAETLTRFRTNQSDKLTIFTNGGGAGVMAADAAAQADIDLVVLDNETVHRLDSVLPTTWSHANPVDIIGDAPVKRYTDTLHALNDDPNTGAILFIHAPTAIVSSESIARALVSLATEIPPRLMGCWLGEASVRDARKIFRDAGIADYSTPEEAVNGFAMLVAYRRNQAQLMESPAVTSATSQSSLSPASGVARKIVQRVLADGREMLSEAEAKELISAFGIRVVATQSVGIQSLDAASAANAIGFPVALKILSKDITHKSDVHGVVLNLEDAGQVHDAVNTMLEHVNLAAPTARIDGFTVQAMVKLDHSHELIVGASVDSVFGPVIMFGQGGTSVELVADRAVALPPLNQALARALVQRTRVAKLLGGFRDTPPADQEALHRIIVAVSELIASVPEVVELDINPLNLSPSGAIALDARIKVSSKSLGGAKHFAIRPYPAELTETIDWQGQKLTLRAIRPEDETQHLAFLGRLDPEDVHMRVFFSKRSIERSELARLTQIDYEREMAIIAVRTDQTGAEETLGVARAIADPDNVDAEFGVIVRSDLKSAGMGRILMDKLISVLRTRGTLRLVGTVLSRNQQMLALAKELGFITDLRDQQNGTKAIHLMLQSKISVD